MCFGNCVIHLKIIIEKHYIKSSCIYLIGHAIYNRWHNSWTGMLPDSLSFPQLRVWLPWSNISLSIYSRQLKWFKDKVEVLFYWMMHKNENQQGSSLELLYNIYIIYIYIYIHVYNIYIYIIIYMYLWKNLIVCFCI